MVLTHRHQDDDEEHPADEQPERPEAKDGTRVLRDRHGNPFSPEQPDVTHVVVDVPQPRLVRRPQGRP